jgi:hypothetical protein
MYMSICVCIMFLKKRYMDVWLRNYMARQSILATKKTLVLAVESILLFHFSLPCKIKFDVV